MTAKNTPDNSGFFADNNDDQPQPQSSFVLDFTQQRNDELIPDGSVVNMSIASAKASNYNGELQFSVRLNVVDGEHEGKGFFENIKLARVLSNGYLEPWYDSTGKSATWKLARLLDGINFNGERVLEGASEPDIIDWLNELGRQIKGELCTVTVNTWGDTSKVDPQTGEPYSKKNGIKKIEPFGTHRTADQLFSS